MLVDSNIVGTTQKTDRFDESCRRVVICGSGGVGGWMRRRGRSERVVRGIDIREHETWSDGLMRMQEALAGAR